MNVIRQLYTTILEKKMTDDEEHLGSLENTFHRLRNVTGLSNVEEVVDKFLTRNTKNDQLQKVTDELSLKIEALKAENKKSTAFLEELVVRTEGNTGNREVYQEVDLIDHAVGSAVKQCEDSKQVRWPKRARSGARRPFYGRIFERAFVAFVSELARV